MDSFKDVLASLVCFAIGTGLLLYSINIQSYTTAIIDDVIFTVGLLFIAGGLMIGTTLQNGKMH